METIGTLRMIPSTEITDSGISIGFECLDREIFNPEKCYDKLAAIGVKNARCQTGWIRCEKEKGVYDFTWLDDVVDNLLRRGVKPWFNVSYGNPLYMDNEGNPACVGMVPLHYGEETLHAWENYVRALAKHYKGRVSHFEIWNEPEGENFWQPKKPDPLEYAKFIRITAAAIKEEFPDAEIGACSMWTFKPDYATPFFMSGIAKELSFYCVHIYRIQPELNFQKEMAALRRLIDANGGTHVELWQGESGYASYFPPKHWLGTYIMESEDNQAKWLLRRFFYDAACGIQMTSFFQMVDMTDKPYQMALSTQNDPARHGILNGGSYTPKKSYSCMGHTAALLDSQTKPRDLYANVSLYSAFPKSMPVSRLADIATITLGFEKHGYPLYVYYLPEDVQMNYAGAKNIELEVLNGECTHNITDPVLIDMLTGEVVAITPNGLGEYNSYFYELPLTDYPLIVTDRKVIENIIRPPEK